MTRRARLGLLSASLFLLALPLTVGKPGLPPTLKSDEPAYFLMAESIAHDGDLSVDTGDLERLFDEFPYRPVSNLILMTDDGWRSVYFGKPYLYSLFAAPFARVAGADGMLLFNMLLLVAMIWMGAAYLARFNTDGTAAVFAAGFFIASAGFSYVFWLHPEVFNMAAVAACLFLGLGPALDRQDAPGEPTAPEDGRARSRRRRAWPATAAVLSGAALSLAVYNKPVIAALALAPLAALAVRRRWRLIALWIAGAAVSLGLATGLAVALTGHATPYLGVERQGVVVCSPDVLPINRTTAATAGEKGTEERPTGGAWSWIFRIPDVHLGRLGENVLYFLAGRHTGLFLYFPFSLLALILFLVHRRRPPGEQAWRWGLLGGLGLVALFFLVFIPANWQGGGGFIGNRYYVNVYPAFLFLVTRIRPRWTVPATFTVAGVFLGTIVLTPFGADVPEPTLQSHVRNPPFRLFPRELTLREVPGYVSVPIGSLQVVARKDVVLPQAGRLWIAAGQPVEIEILAPKPVDGPFQLLVRSDAPRNRIRLQMGDADETVELGAATVQGPEARVSLDPGGPSRFTHRGEPPEPIPVYTLTVTAEHGRSRLWTRHFPPPSCPGSGFAFYDTLEDNFPVGAELVLLGTGDAMDRDVFGVAWNKVTLRDRVLAGQTFYARVGLTNTSGQPWTPGAAAEVHLSYHWYRAAGGAEAGPGTASTAGPTSEAGSGDDGVPAQASAPEAGDLVEFDGLRTHLPLPVAAGESVEVLQEIRAPVEPGRYELVLDPVFEQVSWFSRRGVEPYRTAVAVVAPRAGAQGGQAVPDEIGPEEPSAE